MTMPEATLLGLRVAVLIWLTILGWSFWRVLVVEGWRYLGNFEWAQRHLRRPVPLYEDSLSYIQGVLAGGQAALRQRTAGMLWLAAGVALFLASLWLPAAYMAILTMTDGPQPTPLWLLLASNVLRLSGIAFALHNEVVAALTPMLGRGAFAIVCAATALFVASVTAAAVHIT